MKDSHARILKNHKLRKTDFRLRVLDIFMDQPDQALTQADLETRLDEFDRITLYRTLKSFEKAGIIHEAIDSSSETKFALCHEDCTIHNHRDNHAHFLCSTCDTTYCIDNVVGSDYSLPAGFKLDKVHIALEGTCKACEGQTPDGGK